MSEMMSICLTWFTNWLLIGELQVYNHSGDFTRMWEFAWRVPDCEELVGEVSHTTECVTDLFNLVDVEWRFLWYSSNYLDGNGYSF